MIHVPSDQLWPPPKHWFEAIVLWRDVLEGPHYPIREILKWLETAPGGRYHIHGYESTVGFSFRFEDARDLVHFRLRWL
jgi:hypothetical protein